MTKFLKPGPGRTVDQEDGSPWPAGGMDAPNTLFVRRRLRDGDLIEADRAAIVAAVVEPQPEPAPAPPEPEAATETVRRAKRT